MKARIVPALLLLILSLGLFASAACSGEGTAENPNAAPTANANPAASPSSTAKPGTASATNRGRESDDVTKPKDEATPAPKSDPKTETKSETKSDDLNKDDLNKKVVKLEGDLNELKTKVNDLPTQPGTSSGILGFWLPLSAGILSLLGLGALGYYMWKLKGKIDRAKTRFNELAGTVAETRKSITTTQALAERVETDLNNLNKWKEEAVNDLDALDSNHLKLVDELRQKELNASGGRVVPAVPAPLSVAPDGLDAPFSFPGSAADYLKYLRRKSVPTVEAEPDVVRGNNLIDKPDGQFLVIQNSNNQHAYPVVPNVTRFATSQDFIVYREYFHCDNLSSGDVWIREPAYVVEDAGNRGWKLKEMGRLDVR